MASDNEDTFGGGIVVGVAFAVCVILAFMAGSCRGRKLMRSRAEASSPGSYPGGRGFKSHLRL